MNVFQARDHHLYFIYGSNMNPAQLVTRCASPKVLAIARLAGHRLAFFGHSALWDGGEATVVRHPGEEVWGVVCKLSFRDADALDTWQGVRLDGNGSYFLYPSVVVDAKGDSYPVQFYRKDYCGETRKPSEEYLAHIVAGAVAQGLPADYIERLKRIETRKAGYPVPRKDLGDRSFLLTRACDGCG